MATDRINDLRAFTSFANEKLSDVGGNLTLDDALCLWDYENQTEQERDATREAIAALRRKFNLPELP